MNITGTFRHVTVPLCGGVELDSALSRAGLLRWDSSTSPLTGLGVREAGLLSPPEAMRYQTEWRMFEASLRPLAVALFSPLRWYGEVARMHAVGGSISDKLASAGLYGIPKRWDQHTTHGLLRAMLSPFEGTLRFSEDGERFWPKFDMQLRSMGLYSWMVHNRIGLLQPGQGQFSGYLLDAGQLHDHTRWLLDQTGIDAVELSWDSSIAVSSESCLELLPPGIVSEIERKVRALNALLGTGEARSGFGPLRLRPQVEPVRVQRKQGRPLCVELCCGDGRLLVERASREPGTDWVGVDIGQSFFDGAVQRLAGVPNARALRHDASLLPEIVADGSVQTVHVSMPARLADWLSGFGVSPARRLADILSRALQPGGVVIVRGCYPDELDAISLEAIGAGFDVGGRVRDLEEGGGQLLGDDGLVSTEERRWRRQDGRPIHGLWMKKPESPDGLSAVEASPRS